MIMYWMMIYVNDPPFRRVVRNIEHSPTHTGSDKEIHRQEGGVDVPRSAPLSTGQGKGGRRGGLRVRAHPIWGMYCQREGGGNPKRLA